VLLKGGYKLLARWSKVFNRYFVRIVVFHKLDTYFTFRPCDLESIPVLEMNGKMAYEISVSFSEISYVWKLV